MRYIYIALFLSFVDYSSACNGYVLKLSKYKNCVENPIIKLPDKGFDLNLDKDCNFYLSGCIEVVKTFKTAKATYHVKKPPLPLIDGDVDLCDVSNLLKSNPDISKAIVALGIPTQCPAKAFKKCMGPDMKLSLAKYKNQIGMAAGNTELKLEVEHDVGKSCMELNFSLSKPRKG